MTRALTLLICFCLGFAAQALGAEPQPITLAEARARALKNNLTLCQSRREEQAARWQMVGAVSEVLPHASLISAYSRLDEETVLRSNVIRNVIIEQYHLDPAQIPPFAFENLYTTSLSIDQPIYNGGLEIVGLRIAATRQRQIRQARLAEERQVVLDAETAYYNLCRAQQALDLRIAMCDVSRQYVERFKRRSEIGLAAPVDVMRWEFQAAADDAARVEAQNQFDLAQLSLAYVMGADPPGNYFPADLVEPTSGDELKLPPPDLDSLWNQLQPNSPDLEVMRGNLDLAKHARWAALSGFQPKLNFNYTLSYQPDDDIALDGYQQWTASIALIMPLFASFGHVARFQEAAINLKKVQEGARNYEMGLYIRLASALHNLQSALSRLASAGRMAEQAREVLRIQEDRSAAGLITNLELLDARTAQQQAELSLINARFDALIAQAQIRRLAGS